MEFDIEKHAQLVMESGKQHLTDGMYLPNKDKIGTLGEKETYKYLNILEASGDEKITNNISGELDSYSRQNYFAETLSKESIPRLNPS